MRNTHIDLTLFDGTQSAPAEQSDTTAADRGTPKQRQFRALIAGQYKDEYAAATQRMIDKRFKQYKTMEAEHTAIRPVVTALHDYYGTTDAAGLMSAMSDHHRRTESSRRQLLEGLRKLQAVQAGFGAHLAAEAKLRDWQTQAEQLKGLYGDYDLTQAAADPAFRAMLQAGVPMDKAWLSLHLPQVQAAQPRAAAAVRPEENGTADRSPLLPGRDVSRLSRADRADLAKRSLKGETIRL